LYNNIYITGNSSYSGVGSDYTTIKYNQLVSINGNINEFPNSFSLYQNYPNPFNPVTKIRFDIPSVGAQYIEPLQLKVYDIIGREVATLVNEQLKPGTYEVEWDGSAYASGVYFYSLISENYFKTNKMILLR